jgi:SAM-dependent methyltransferase
MPKLFTTTHDIPALEQRLKNLLDEPPERVASFLPKPTFFQRLVRRAMAAGPVPRRVVNGLKTWRLTGYSTRWLLLKIPMVRPFARRVRAFVYFRRTVNSHLQHLESLVRQNHVHHGAEQKRLEQLLRDSQERISKLSSNADFFESIQANMQTRLTRLEAAGSQEADFSHAGKADATDYAAYYAAFENIYRGESSAIETRFEPYLDFIRAGVAGDMKSVALDLGCGRGEWLSILRREGIDAMGVDSDAAMLAPARERGEHVVQGDLIAFLEDAAPASYGAITAFQVIEHLPLESLLRLFNAAQRALRPGGVIVLETPNPENLQVASYSFWLDPTHMRPLPPPLLDHFARYFGFIDIHIVRSHPWPAEQHFPEDMQANRYLNKLLFCEQDYALVARKPL